MNPNTYTTIMIGHTLAKLYGAIMEVELSDYIETLKFCALEQVGLDEPCLLLIISSHLDV